MRDETLEKPITFADGEMIIEFKDFGLDSYRLFLKAKQIPEYRVEWDEANDHYRIITPARFANMIGVERPARPSIDLPYNPCLYDDQVAITDMALESKRFAVWSNCGLGKSLCEFEFARQVMHRTGGKALLVSLNEVVPQLITEAQRFYPDMPMIRLGSQNEMRSWCETGSGLAITNYEKFNPKGLDGGIIPELGKLTCIILDECFAKGTFIDAIDDNGRIFRKAVEEFRVGDTIINASGTDTISDVHRREVPYAVQLVIRGETIVVSPNHPFATRRGWIGAQDLEPGDAVVATATAVRMVHDGFHPGEFQEARSQSLLRPILLSEMAYESAYPQSQGPQRRDVFQDLRVADAMDEFRSSDRYWTAGTNPQPQPDFRPGSEGQDFPPLESHEARTFRAWGEWSGDDGTSENLEGCSREWMDGRVCLVTGPTDTRLSHVLQARLGESRSQSRYRGGWVLPCLPEGQGSEERSQTYFARVESLEVLEPGHPELERLRDADGKLYFYDLGGTRHPSFSVAGCLVHNSSRLKGGGDSRQKKVINRSCKGIEFKLSCTATPAPNDAIEFTSQATFLEKVRTDQDIIWSYFTRNTKTNKRDIRPHARKAFFEFMASWSVYLKNPKRFGWRLDLPEVPDPDYFTHTIPSTEAQRRESLRVVTNKTGTGSLFISRETNAIERAKLAQVARGFRYVKGATGSGRTIRPIESLKPTFVADLARSEVAAGHQVIIWTTFDEESAILARLLEGESYALLVGSTKPDERLEILDRFRRGEIRLVITRAKILGWGLNLQFVTSMIVSGLSESFEELYQLIRRAVRHGQLERVRVHFPVVDGLEEETFQNLMRKSRDHERATSEMEDNYLASFRTLMGVAG